MSKMKDLFEEVCERYKQEHVGFPEKDVEKFLLDNGTMLAPIRFPFLYLKRDTKSYQLGKFKKRIIIRYTSEEEAREAAFNIHKQLMKNQDYLNGDIIVQLGIDPTMLHVCVLNYVKEVPEILL